MTSNSLADFIPTVGSLLSVATGSLITYFIGLSHFERTRKKEWEDILRQKIEDVYILAEEISGAVPLRTQILLLYFRGAKDIEIFKFPGIPIPKLCMTVNLYMPELRQYAEKIEFLFIDSIEIEQYLHSSRDCKSEEIEEHEERLMENEMKIWEVCKVIQQELGEISQMIIHLKRIKKHLLNLFPLNKRIYPSNSQSSLIRLYSLISSCKLSNAGNELGGE
jgi:hypothetical protein